MRLEIKKENIKGMTIPDILRKKNGELKTDDEISKHSEHSLYKMLNEIISFRKEIDEV